MNSATAEAAGSLRGRLAATRSDPLWRSAYSLMLNVALTSVLGFAFWILAARIFPASAVGRDSALVSAMITLSTVCQLNLGPGILRFLPVVKIDPRRVVSASYAVTCVLTAVMGVAFVLLAPALSSGYSFLRTDPAIAVLYVAAVASWGVFALQDAVLTAMRRAPWVPLENATFGVLKLASLPVLLALGAAHAVFVAWVIPMVMLLVPVNYLIYRRVLPLRPAHSSEQSPIERFGRRGLARFLAQDYLASIFAQASSTVLPVLIVGIVGTTANAYFYIPFMIVSSFDLLFLNVTSSLTVEGALARARLPSLVRDVARRVKWQLTVGVVVLVGAASLILAPFGAAYVTAGVPVLRLLACASAFRCVGAVYVAICRVEGRASRILAMQGAVFALVVAGTVVLGRSHGINGVAAAWLIANALTGLVVLPHVRRTLRA